ncbi:hypothetical protein HG15A2_09310 [Adhaeretor mobilis]|uniref:Uncharacterized protein n=1 Tax=Adhaeretor mobilis TaxID=1930276 RepID=A0A517MSA7_9BACT|nr:hypothetical protein HG15A2_09310 [Adhaeretor mobilis]
MTGTKGNFTRDLFVLSLSYFACRCRSPQQLKFRKSLTLLSSALLGALFRQRGKCVQVGNGCQSNALGGVGDERNVDYGWLS